MSDQTNPIMITPAWGFLVAGLIFGLLTTLALAPFDLWMLAFVAPLPLLWSAANLRRTGTRRQTAIRLAMLSLGTLPCWLYQYVWIATNSSPAGYPILALYMSFYPALTALLIARVCDRTRSPAPWIVAMLIGTTTELLRAELVGTGYPWYLAAQPIIEAPWLAMPGAVIGVYGVSALIFGIAGSLATLAGWFNGASRRTATIGLIAIAVLWAALSLLGRPGPATDERSINVGAVQSVIPQSIKTFGTPEEDLRAFEAMVKASISLRDTGVDCIVWPETMIKAWCFNDDGIIEYGRLTNGRTPSYADEVRRVQQRLGVPMLVGAMTRLPPFRLEGEPGAQYIYATTSHNSIYLLQDGQVADRYDKVALTPFGEQMPLVWRFEAVQDLLLSIAAKGLAFDLKAGNSLDPINVPTRAGEGVRVATPICFEVTKAGHCRRMVRRHQPELLINISNDAWFGATANGRPQHLQLARWRSLELARPMVRAVNTGISANIDHRGIVLDQASDDRHPTAETTGLPFTVMVASRPMTPYAMGGYLAAWALFAGALLMIASAAFGRLGPVRTRDTGDPDD